MREVINIDDIINERNGFYHTGILNKSDINKIFYIVDRHNINKSFIVRLLKISNLLRENDNEYNYHIFYNFQDLYTNEKITILEGQYIIAEYRKN